MYPSKKKVIDGTGRFSTKLQVPFYKKKKLLSCLEIKCPPLRTTLEERRCGEFMSLKGERLYLTKKLKNFLYEYVF